MSVNCRFLPIHRVAQNFQKKIYKKSARRKLPESRRRSRGGPPPPRRPPAPPPPWPCQEGTWGWGPLPVPPFGLYFPLGPETLGSPFFSDLLLCPTAEAIPRPGEPDGPV